MNRITPTETLQCGWRLIHDPDNRGKDEKWFLGIPERGAVSAEVPSFVHQYLPDCHGIAWYQRDFRTGLRPDDAHSAFLRFEMADFLCEVWLNGARLGVHRGTENPFSFDVTRELNPYGENRLVVRVSKPYTEDVDGYSFLEIPHRNQMPSGILPGTCYDSYGIHGAVTLALLPKARICDLYLTGNVQTESIDAVLTLANDFADSIPVRLDLLAAETRTGVARASDESHLLLPPGETVLRRSLPIAEMRLWDLDDPFLYAVSAELSAGGASHAVSKRCGFRTFLVGTDGYFYLNGRRIFLRCSHTGNCMPESTWMLSRDHSLIRKDFAMAKSVGMNMVRFISGTALPEQLDLCDELGLMVYEEPVSSWLQGDSPRAREIYHHDLLTMIRRDRSHACVTIWGLLNETVNRPPYGDCCIIARESIPEVRALDETRLLLYSSGRFDHDRSVGSVCNPHSHRWECLWDGESEGGGIQPLIPGEPGPTRRYLGDKHFYPRLPHSHSDIAYFRALGSDTKRPFFLSEYGVGSLFDVIWLSRKLEQMHSDPRYPDVKMIHAMAESFLSDLKEYGFDREYAFPIDIMRESHRLHNRHREIGFDIFRSNPYCNGVSLTGLLDHSICGEGLWTLLREWKCGIADTLQDGFAPLRWCLFLSEMHLTSGQPFTIEGVLANEDVLEARSYPIGVKIVGREGIVWEETLRLDVRPEDLKGLAVPAFKRELALALPEGEYTLRAELLEGAAAAGGRLSFHVSEDARSCAAVNRIAGICIGANAESFLARKGVAVLPADPANGERLALVGDIPEEEKESAWKTIRALLDAGATVVLGSRFAMAKGDDWTAYAPIPIQSFPAQRGPTDWLYHKEYLAKRNHPYFSGLPTGMMSWDYYRYLIRGAYFRSDEKAEDVASICFGVGEHAPGGYQGGMELCAYAVGRGRLVLNAYALLENLNQNPAADRLLLNILNAESARLKPD